MKTLIFFSFLVLICLAFEYQQKIDVSQYYVSQLTKQYPRNYTYQIYVGYLPVGDPGAQGYLFYKFVSQQGTLIDSQTGQTPTIIYQEGGPGCSSSVNSMQQMGPYHLIAENNTLRLIENPYAFTLQANMIFFDALVGEGYSQIGNFTYTPNNTEDSSRLFHQALIQLFNIYPFLKVTPLYFWGESYGGHFQPSLLARLLVNNFTMNLQGLGVGDGFTDGFIQLYAYNPYYYSIGIIPYGIMQKNKLLQGQMLEDILKQVIELNYKEAQALNADVENQADTAQINIMNYRQQNTDDLAYSSALTIAWLTQNSTLTAFGQPPGAFSTLQEINNINCNGDIGNAWEFSDFAAQFSDNYSIILKAGARVIIFSGQVDALVSQNGAEKMINQLNWEFLPEYQNTQFQQWTAQNGQSILGQMKQARNLQFVVVNNAGHLVPYYQPEAGAILLYNYLNQLQNWEN